MFYVSTFYKFAPASPCSKYSLSFFIDNQYKYTLCLYIAFGSFTNWLTKALAEHTGLGENGTILYKSTVEQIKYVAFSKSVCHYFSISRVLSLLSS